MEQNNEKKLDDRIMKQIEHMFENVKKENILQVPPLSLE